MAERIGEILLEIEAMSQEQVEDVLRRQRDGDDRVFGAIALELEYIDHKALAAYLVQKTKPKFRNFYNYDSKNIS